MKSTTFSKY